MVEPVVGEEVVVMKNLLQYRSHPVFPNVEALRKEAGRSPIILVASTLLLATLAAILQYSADLPARAGFPISLLATAPILLSTALSLRLGVMAYGITMLLLIRVQSAQVVVFVFTTGLLGLGIGAGIRLLKKRSLIAPIAGLLLFMGINSLAAVLNWAGLGSLDVPSKFGPLLLFTMIYSGLWTELSTLGLRWLSRTLVHAPDEGTLETIDDSKR